MKQKTLTLIITAIFLIGIVAAAGTIINISESLEITPSTFIAGSTTTAEFSFDYPDISEQYPNQEDYAPLVIKVDITSEDQENYPVWKGDFKLDGSLLNKGWWIIFPDTLYYFDCYEDDFTYYYNQNPYDVINISNGTFYCYNPIFSAMRIGSSNDVTLNINSNPALWPGIYNVSVDLYYPSEEEIQPEDQYIKVDVTPIVNSVPYGQDSTVEFNMTLEIKGGNAIKMKMSDLINQNSPYNSYTPEELNARLIYDGIEYDVRETYENSEQIVFGSDDEIITETVVFKMDIKSDMKPGNYHGTYRFNVTKENL